MHVHLLRLVFPWWKYHITIRHHHFTCITVWPSRSMQIFKQYYDWKGCPGLHDVGAFTWQRQIQHSLDPAETDILAFLAQYTEDVCDIANDRVLGIFTLNWLLAGHRVRLDNYIVSYWVHVMIIVLCQSDSCSISSKIMMTSSNGNIFRVTGHLCGEFTGRRWIPRTKASDAELWSFLWSAPE